MPQASELEEFGLEVENEHVALVGTNDNLNSSSRHDAMEFARPSTRRLSPPTKFQLELLQSTNRPLGVRPIRLLRPGMLRWACLVIVLAVIVFLNVGQEQEETLSLEEEILETKNKTKNWLLHPGKIPIGKGKNTNFGSFTLERLEATRQVAQSLVAVIEEYYFGAEQTQRMLLDSWSGPWNFDNLEVSPGNKDRVEKLVDTMARALVTDEQEEFLIGTIGSSVGAGHDNCHYDSYESQLERTLGPVWEAAGMKLICQNAGEGGGCGDTFANQVYCIKQNVSPKIDIAHYTWSYFQVGAEDSAVSSRESLIRWTQMLPRQPPVHVLDVLEDVPARENEVNMTEYYAKYGYSSFFMRYSLHEGGHDYNTDQENGLDHFGWGIIGDGYHNVTRYGENEENPERKGSLGVVMRNWHPGPLGFQVVSDAFSFVYSKAILIALDRIQKDLDEGKDPRETWLASKRKVLSKKSLPDPLHCNPEYCVVDEAPGCLNFELPTFGEWGARIERPDDNLNPHKGELQNWEMWREPNYIWYMVSREDIVYFQDREDKEICRHLDACGGISATSSENGMVVFRLPKMEVGLVAICGCCGQDVGERMFINNTNIEVQYNGALLDPSTWDVFPNNKCVRLFSRFPTEGAAAETPTGHAYLSIKALDLSEPVRISHVITL